MGCPVEQIPTRGNINERFSKWHRCCLGSMGDELSSSAFFSSSGATSLFLLVEISLEVNISQSGNCGAFDAVSAIPNINYELVSPCSKLS